MSGAKRILPLLAVLCFALFLLYGVYFNAFGANAESMMTFFGITESRQGFVMTIQSLGGIVMTVLLGLFGERLHKLYGLLAGAVLVGVAGVTIGTMPLYGNDSYGLLLVFALIGGVGYITIDLLMNGVIADVFPEKKSTLLPIVHGFYGLGAMLAPLLVTWLTDSSRPATFAVPYLVLGAAALVLGAVFWTVSRRATPHTPYADMTALRDRSVANPAEIFRDKRAWLYLLCCFLYLCFQNGIAVWLPNYYKTVHHMAGGAANAMLTLFSWAHWWSVCSRRWCISVCRCGLSICLPVFVGRRVCGFAADAVPGRPAGASGAAGAAAGRGGPGPGDPLLRDVPHSDGFGLIHHRAGRISVSTDRAHGAGAAHRAGRLRHPPVGPDGLPAAVGGGAAGHTP